MQNKKFKRKKKIGVYLIRRKTRFLEVERKARLFVFFHIDEIKLREKYEGTNEGHG